MAVILVFLSLFMSSVHFIYWGVRRYEDLIWYKWTQLSKRNQIIYKVICDHSDTTQSHMMMVQNKGKVEGAKIINHPSKTAHPWILHNKYTWILRAFIMWTSSFPSGFGWQHNFHYFQNIVLVSMLWGRGDLQYTWSLFLHGNILFSFHMSVKYLNFLV